MFGGRLPAPLLVAVYGNGVSRVGVVYSASMKPASRFTENHKHYACAANNKPVKHRVRSNIRHQKLQKKVVGRSDHAFKHAHPGMLQEG